MTRDHDRKRIIRDRMKTTGESYTTARRHVLATAAKAAPRVTARKSARPLESATATSRVAVIKSAPPVVDQAAIAGQSDATIKRQTGHTWTEWVRLLDDHGAATMTHGAIARLVHEEYGVPGWWSQSVTVGYERLKGLRERGQRLNGAYEVSKSKTFNVPVTTLFDAWADASARRRWLAGTEVTVRTATSPKSMRLQWPDRTIVAAWFTSKGATKSVVSVAHTKLVTRASMEKTKTEWNARLDALAQFLADRDG